MISEGKFHKENPLFMSFMSFVFLLSNLPSSNPVNLVNPVKIPLHQFR